MKNKVGFYVRENTLDLISGQGSEPLSLSYSGSFPLHVNNYFENLSLEEEKVFDLNNQTIKKALSVAKLNEAEANLVIPDEKCSLQIIKLPLVSEKEIISAIELQSEEFVPYPIDKASFDYQILSIDKENNQMFLLLIVALKELIDKVSDYALNLGFYPTNIESESTALYRLIFNQYLQVKENILMLINIGSNSTQISILNNSQQQLITTNNLNIGHNFFYKALQNNLNIGRQDSETMFHTLKAEDPNYQRVIKPVFSEFAKEVNKILMSALEKIGTLPSNIYLNTPRSVNTFTLMFNDHPALQQYQVSPLNLAPLNTTKVKLPEGFQAKLGSYLVPFGAIV